jgi:hypothetical protein
MAAMDYDWLAKLLEKDPAAVRHHLVSTDDEAKNAQIVLTADTPELQKFVLRHLNTQEAWNDPLELQRD